MWLIASLLEAATSLTPSTRTKTFGFSIVMSEEDDGKSIPVTLRAKLVAAEQVQGVAQVLDATFVLSKMMCLSSKRPSHSLH